MQRDVVCDAVRIGEREGARPFAVERDACKRHDGLFRQDSIVVPEGELTLSELRIPLDAVEQPVSGNIEEP